MSNPWSVTPAGLVDASHSVEVHMRTCPVAGVEGILVSVSPERDVLPPPPVIAEGDQFVPSHTRESPSVLPVSSALPKSSTLMLDFS